MNLLGTFTTDNCVTIIFEINFCMICSILNSLAAVRRENTSASNVFVFVCVFSSLLPAPHTEAAFLLSGQHSYVVGLRRTCVGLTIHKLIHFSSACHETVMWQNDDVKTWFFAFPNLLPYFWIFWLKTISVHQKLNTKNTRKRANALKYGIFKIWNLI